MSITNPWHEASRVFAPQSEAKQGKRELLWFRGKSLNHRYNTAGRNRNMACTNAGSVRGVGDVP